MNFEEDSSDGDRYEFDHDKYVASVGEGRFVRLQELNGNLMLIFFFSVLTVLDATVQESELAAASTESINTTAAIAIGIVSILITLLRYVHSCCVEDELSPGFQLGIAVALAFLWSFGVYFLTFLDSGTFANIISSGFFAVWACLLVSITYVGTSFGKVTENGNGGCGLDWCCCGYDIKKGVTGSLGISIIFCIAVIISASSEPDIGGLFAMGLSIIILLPLATMICVPYDRYNDLDRFTFLMMVLIFLSFIIILASTTVGPFVERLIDEEPLSVNGNGYFAVIGLFLALVALFWQSHVFIIFVNREGGGDFGMQGRYIWSFLLVLSSIVMISAGAVECSNFDQGCNENQFLPASLILGGATIGIVILCYLIGRENIDNGDDQILSPGSGFDFFDNNFQRMEFIGAFILQIAWAGAAFTFTFVANSPFNSAANGFFFAWIGFFFASQYFSSIYPKFSLTKLSCLEWEPPNGMDRRNNFGLGLGAAGILIQFIDIVVTATRKLVDGDGIETEEFAAVGCQVLTLISIVVLACVRPSRLGKGAILLSYFYVLAAYLQLVITTVVLNPFDGNEGNGFFAAWLIMYGSIYNLNHYEWSVSAENPNL